MLLPEKIKSQITVLMCNTASGKVLPPYILFPGKQVNPSYAMDSPAGTKRFSQKWAG